jgi:4'-phosphopantetheinyl transferase
MSDVDVLLVSPGEPAVIPADLLSALVPGEHARAMRFVQARDRWLFVLGRALVRYGLRERFGIAHARLHVPRGGKPALDPERDGIDFSLSHTRGYVACAFGRGCDLGVDVERYDRVIEVEGMARSYFAAPERDLLNRADPSERGEVFLRLWTLKEAVVKATGMGLALDLDAFAVALDPPQLKTSTPELGDNRLWQLHQWRLPNASQLALAIRHPKPRPISVTLAEVPLADLAARRQRSESAG